MLSKKLYFCFPSLIFSLLLLPLTQAAFDDEKSPDVSSHYTISNPLVLLTGAVTYDCYYTDNNKKYFLKSLPGVVKDLEILYDLFKNKCGYDVVSTYHKGGSKIKKSLTKKDLDDFLHSQYNYLRSNRKKYDALIFSFSGHGDGNYYGNDTIFTSDGGSMYFAHIEKKFTYGADDTFLGDFASKPKLFFKLACRGGGRPKYIKEAQRVGNSSGFIGAGSEVFIACATSPGYSMYDASGKLFTTLLSNFICSYLSNKNGDLMDIDRKIKAELSKTEAPRSITGLTKKVFFAKKRALYGKDKLLVRTRPMDLPYRRAPQIMFCMRFSTTNNLLASYSISDYLDIWDAEKGKIMSTAMGVSMLSGMNDFCFSLDGRFLAGASIRGGVRIWNPYTGELITVIDIPACSLSFSPSNKLIASAHNGISIYNIFTKKKYKL